MSEHVLDWIPAYYDGELTGERRTAVETHLAGCASCRAELEALRALSMLLQAGALAEVSPESNRAFTGEVLRRLPPPRQVFWRQAVRTGWRYAPLALFAAWAFIQAVVWVSGGVLLALAAIPGAAGLLPLADGASASLLSWLVDGLLPLSWLFDLPHLVNRSLFGSLALVTFVTACLLAVLFLAWLASLWAYQKRAAIV